MQRILRSLAIVQLVLVSFMAARPVAAQGVGRLLSPGPLSSAHSRYEGLDNCEKCHEPGKGVSAQRCLACHRPIAQRIAERKGVHRDVRNDCTACHVEHAVRAVDFRGASTDCASCHRDPHAGSLGAACASCHGTRVFLMSTYQHPRYPEFFAGSHAALECAKCHKSSNGATGDVSPVSSRTYRGMSTECATCHRDAQLGQLGVQCASCHAVAAASFKDERFDHGRSGFRLTGRHATIECVACHKPETGEFPAGSGTAVRFNGTGSTCVSCHRDVHLGQLGDRCSDCHQTESFKIASYRHGGDSDFFSGSHATIECRQCHPTVEGDFAAGHGEAMRFAGLDRQCATCHNDVHEGTLGTDCASCHTVDAPFRDPSRAFHKATMLPLEGRHLQVPCADCHWNGQIKGTPTRCYDCHRIRRQDDRYRTRLGNECEQCHRPTSWTAVTWDHGAATGHALLGPHGTLECEACHDGGRFEGGLGTDCVSCHLDDYNNADDPDHVDAGFSTDCTQCHSASDPDWGNGDFGHDIYPLVGAHAAEPCESCHSSGIYQGLPSDCVDCHLDDYQATTDPNHTAAGFPTTCDVCHDAADVSWEEGQFDHIWFPIASGRHSGFDCADCHPNPSSFVVFTCTTSCHPRGEMDDEHSDVSGYVYDSAACLSCHPGGDERFGRTVRSHGPTRRSRGRR